MIIAHPVTPRIEFYLNNSLSPSHVVFNPRSGSSELLECKTAITEPTIKVDTVEWWFNGLPFLDRVPVLNLSDLQPQSAVFQCRVYSRFFNVSRNITVTIKGGGLFMFTISFIIFIYFILHRSTSTYQLNRLTDFINECFNRMEGNLIKFNIFKHLNVSFSLRTWIFYTINLNTQLSQMRRFL